MPVGRSVRRFVQKTDRFGNLLFDEITGEPIMIPAPRSKDDDQTPFLSVGALIIAKPVKQKKAEGQEKEE